MSESVPKPMPASWPRSRSRPQSAPRAQRTGPSSPAPPPSSGVNPAASRIGALITTATPNPVTDSKKGATPTTTTGRERHRSGSSLPRNRDTASTAPPAESRLYSNNPPNSTYNTCSQRSRAPEQSPRHRREAPGRATPTPRLPPPPATTAPDHAAQADPKRNSPTAATAKGNAEITMPNVYLP